MRIVVRADMHLHSRFSKEPVELPEKLVKIVAPTGLDTLLKGSQESYALPENLYLLAQQVNMHFMPLTDHNTDEGFHYLKELGYPEEYIPKEDINHFKHLFPKGLINKDHGLPGIIRAQEVSTSFPDTNCTIHIPVYNYTNKQLKEIKRLSKDVRLLVPFLKNEGIEHYLAHIFFPPNYNMSVADSERCFVMFDIFEKNGSRCNGVNDALEKLIKHQLTEEMLQGFAQEHKIQFGNTNPKQKYLIGGSDNHSGIPALVYTENPGISFSDFFNNAKDNRIITRFISPDNLTYEEGRIAKEYFNELFGHHKIWQYIWKIPGGRKLHKIISHKEPDSPIDIFKRTAAHERYEKKKKRIEAYKEAVKRAITAAVIPHLPKGYTRRKVSEILHPAFADHHMLKALHELDIPLHDLSYETAPKKFREALTEILDKSFISLTEYIIDTSKKGNIFRLPNALPSYTPLLAISVIPSLSYNLFEQSWNNLREFKNKNLKHIPKSIRIAEFTDTLYETNGVALTRRETMQAIFNLREKGKLDAEYDVITCASKDNIGNEKRYSPIIEKEMPLYPELKIAAPSFLTVLRDCYNKGYTHYHAATPGLMGIYAKIIAAILNKPFIASYLTSFPQYAKELAGSDKLEDLMWRYTTWFHKDAALNLINSEENKKELLSIGIPEETMYVMKRGIHTDVFTPRITYEDDPQKEKTFLYVGRFSREKDVHIAAQAYKQFVDILKANGENPDTKFLIVGDGPDLEYITNVLATFNGHPHEYLKRIEGEELQKAYDRAGALVFPSRTDTHGRVILEAMAKGIPVLVSDKGGPMEKVIDGENGFIIPGEDIHGFSEKMMYLYQNPQEMRRMGENARAFAETRSFDNYVIDLVQRIQTI
jgi:glycosyltransferase involved in cell wall biosynthesis